MIVEDILAEFESGELRVIEGDTKNGFVLNTDNKEKVMQIMAQVPVKYSHSAGDYVDKVPLRTKFESFRVVPGAVVRRGSYIGMGVVVMPSFVNIGSYIGAKTMIDSYVTVGSCAYIGENCHISSSTVIAGVLEPISAMPVIIEDNVFIGAQCLVSEGVRVGTGAVLASGVRLTSSVKIIDQDGNAYKDVPPFAVVVPGGYQKGSVFIECAVIVKYVDQKVREKTSINQILREV